MASSIPSAKSSKRCVIQDSERTAGSRSFVRGKPSASGGYVKEQKELEAVIAEEEQKITACEQTAINTDSFLKLAAKYTDFSELTTPMLNEFVDKIIVHAPERIDRDRVQEVEIYLKFIGRFDIPEHEPTAEEIEQMKVKQYWKDKYWNHKKYELARRKRQKEAREAEQAKTKPAEQEKKIAAALSEVRAETEAAQASGDINSFVVSVALQPNKTGVKAE